jgi:hypothetical protein
MISIYNLRQISIPSQRLHVTFACILCICQLTNVPLEFPRTNGIRVAECIIIGIQALSTLDILYCGGLHDLRNDIISDMFENFQIFRAFDHADEILERFRIFICLSMHCFSELLLIDVSQNLLVNIIRIRD